MARALHSKGCRFSNFCKTPLQASNSIGLILLRGDEGLQDVGEEVEEGGAVLVVISRAFAAAPDLQPIPFPMLPIRFLNVHINEI